MRIVGLDIHRVSAEAVMLDEGKAVRLGRVGMTREHLDAFARAVLTHDDHVVVEATGNATAVAEVLAPHVGRVVIANPRQVRLIAEARIKTDVIDATVLARLYASGFLPEVWVPDARTEALRRQVTRRMQIVRRRARLKTMIQSILHAHLVPPCPHADLLGPKGRAWLLEQPLPPDEADAVARHLREHDRLSEDLRVVEREIARDALANPDAKRLMTIPGIDMVVAVGLLAAIGPVTRFDGPDKLVSYLGLNPTVHRSGEGRPRHGRISKQGRTHARTMLVEAGRGGLAGGARPRTAARVLRAGRPAARGAHRRGRRRTQARRHHLAPAQEGRGLRLGATGAPRQEAARPRAPLRAARAPRPARPGLRLQSHPDPPRGAQEGRAGGAGLPPPDRGLDPARTEGAHGCRKGGATLKAARPGSHLVPGSLPRGHPWTGGG